MKWALAFLLLAGCDQIQKKDNVQLAMKAGEQEAEIAQLRVEIDGLKDEQRDQANLLKATTDAQTATYNSLDSLRSTFNNNVEIDNKRNTNLVSHVTTLERRVYGTQ